MKRILLIGILLGINSYDAFAITERKQYDQQHDFIPQLCPDLGRNQVSGLQQAGDQLNIDDRNWRVVEINPIGQPSGVTRIDNITTNNNRCRYSVQPPLNKPHDGEVNLIIEPQ